MRESVEKKVPTALLIGLIGFPQISETIYTPALPSVASGLFTTVYLVEATLAIYFLGFAVGVLLWGIISDEIGRRKAMLMGLFIYGIATVGCANVEEVYSLLIWRFIQAFGASVGSVITQTMLRDCYEGAKRIKFFALMSGALAFSPAIGPLLGGFISEFLGWRANFWSLAILAVILTLWSLMSLPETRPKQLERLSISKIGQLFKEMMQSRILWGHILLIAATNGILFGFYQEAPFVFIEQLGMEPKFYGLFGLLIAAATVIASRISYLKSSRFSAEEMIRFGAVCVCGGAFMFMGAITTGLFELNSLGILVAIGTLFFVFFGIGLIIPNSLSHALKPYQRAVGSAGSIFGSCYYVLIAAFTWLMSFLHNGTALPLPIYMTFLGGILIVGSQLVGFKKCYSEKMD